MRLGHVLDVLPAKAAIPLRARCGHRDPEVAHLHRFASAGDTVLDVGAHKGAYTWHLARIVGAAGRVHAFEPQPDLARRLRRACPSQVVVHECALSDQNASAALSVPLWGSTRMQGHASLEATRPEQATGYEVEVRTRRGDDLHLSPTFVKADIEGHELSMLRGAEETITRCWPALLLEIDYRHKNESSRRRELLSWLADHRYTAHYVDRGRLVAFGNLPADRDPNEALGADAYVYNWFLLPA